MEQVDTLDAILECASDVLRDYCGDDESTTRIVRLASYVVAHLGGPPYGMDRVGAVSRARTADNRAVWRSGDLIGFGDLDRPEWPPRGIPMCFVEDYVVALLRLMEPEPGNTGTEH